MLGSLTEADDAVQDTWVRLSRSGAADVENLGGWLTTIVARVCLNMLRSRHHRREEPLLPDPVVSPEAGIGPEEQALLADSVGLALLIVLDTLSPDERLAFVLHDMFELPFKEIAPMVGRSPAAAKHDVARQREVVDAFFAAARRGDFDALVAVLHPDVVLQVDGSPRHLEASMALRGSAAVARQAAMGIRYLLGRSGAVLRPVLVNGSAGVLLCMDGQPVTLMSFTVAEGKIVYVAGIADPGRVRRIMLTGG